MAFLALAVLSAGDVAVPGLAANLPWLVWVAVAISGLAVVLNSISQERR